MRSTGEVMGIDRTFGMAFAKSQSGAGQHAAAPGHGVPLARRPRQGQRARRGPPLRRARLRDRGDGRHRRHARAGRASRSTRSSPRSASRSGVDAVDLISSGKVDLVVNTPRGRGPRTDGMHIRRAAIVARRRLRHHRRRRARGRGRHRRGVAARARSALAAGVPPRRPAEARAVRRGRAPARAAPPVDGPSTSRVDLGPVHLPNPVVAASGTFGHGAEVAEPVRPARARRGDGEVGRRVRVVGQSAAARHRSARRRHAQLGRASRARASTRGSSTTFPRSKRAARA